MEEQMGVVTMKGNPMTLLGNPIQVGDTAPAVPLTAQDMSAVNPLEHGAGKTKLFVVVPSVDTSVCSLESKKFSEAMKSLGDQVAGYVISVDLPFALRRWCAAEGVDNLTMLSDYRDAAFGKAYGLYMKEIGLLARAVLVVDKNNSVVYREIVPEVASEPNYDEALAVVKKETEVGS